MDATNIFTAGELINSYTSIHADPPRISMQSQQAKHTVPTYEQSRPLYGSGIERTLPYMISTDFVFKAEQDGVIETIDEKNELVTIKYKDGTTDVIDISDKVSKNSNGGFYITNKKECLYKEGHKFKKDDILARNPQFFVGDKEDMTYCQGYLARVALHQGDYTLEDSSIVTKKLSNAMATDITMMKSIKLGKNTNILSIKKKHDHVKTGEPLLIFEHSFEDIEANDLLNNINDDMTDFIEEIGRDKVVSKYTGEIVEFKLYYNLPEEEFSESIQNLIKKYKSEIGSKKRVIDKTDNKSTILPTTEMIDNEKIKGELFEGLVIEFYVRHKVTLETGDKITYGTALKTIVSDVINEGEEPYSELKPDEPILAVVSPMSVISRMTTDFYNILYTNKLILGMKDKVEEIWNS